MIQTLVPKPKTFEWPRRRQPVENATPAILITFDVPYIKGRDLTKQPLRESARPELEAIAQVCDTPTSRQENGAVAKW